MESFPLRVIPEWAFMHRISVFALALIRKPTGVMPIRVRTHFKHLIARHLLKSAMS
ncbi:hypothetical protein KSX_61410 [Ktedonospora formicarum]|uniref:Uncharacterized protein n=1 Tax=Ktedonospora formicarum TaxID=2778364 RepID=A0A8J3I6G3_9CHLR|nr:hypothetical protein KSX_61410 [Ktedonospora formicarum]